MKRSHYCDDFGICTVILYLWTGKTVEYQWMDDKPMFVVFTGFGDVHYEVMYPDGDLFEILKEEGTLVKRDFWKSAKI